MKNREKSTYFIIGPFAIIILLVIFADIFSYLFRYNGTSSILYYINITISSLMIISVILLIPSLIYGITLIFLKDKNILMIENQTIKNPNPEMK